MVLKCFSKELFDLGMLYMNYVKLDCTQIEGLFHSVYFYCGFDSNMKRQGQSQYFTRSMQKEKNELKRAKRKEANLFSIKLRDH